MGGRIESTAARCACSKAPLHGAALCAHNDHRAAMAMAVAALAAGVPASIDGAECVEKSWPEFWQVLQTCLWRGGDAAVSGLLKRRFCIVGLAFWAAPMPCA